MFSGFWRMWLKLKYKITKQLKCLIAADNFEQETFQDQPQCEILKSKSAQDYSI